MNLDVGSWTVSGIFIHADPSLKMDHMIKARIHLVLQHFFLGRKRMHLLLSTLLNKFAFITLPYALGQPSLPDYLLKLEYVIW